MGQPVDFSEIVVGSKWVSGNTFAPTNGKVVALRGWDQLSAKEQRDQIIIASGHKKPADFAGEVFVVFRDREGRGVLPLDVFAATRYKSLDAMIVAYGENRF